jgi:hypothetical protein
MKTKLRLLSGLFLVWAFLFSARSYSQINYTQNFDDEEAIDWTTYGFWLADSEEYACGTTGYSAVTELYTYYDEESVVTSSSLGVSNGMPATLSYSYKILDYYEYTAYPNDPDWGSFTIEYATSLAGPWTTIETVLPANHTVSDACAVRTVTFTPPAGYNTYIRLRALANQDEELEIDLYLYLDNVSITQPASPACTGTPAASATVGTALALCNGKSSTLSLSPAYFSPGITYQWQRSTNGTDYTNITTAGTAATYAVNQTATTWYRAIVTCSGSSETTTSTPVQITTLNIDCPCEIEFWSAIEPITLVNFAGINNASPNSEMTPSVEDFTNIAPAQVTQGVSYPITLKGNTVDEPDNEEPYVNYFKVYIDWNHNGSFDDNGESYEIGTIVSSNGEDNVSATGNITVPSTAVPGVTFMRVIKNYDEYSADACDEEFNLGYGQAEDYLVNVNAATAEGCTTAPLASVIEAENTTICQGTNTELSLSNTYDEEITYQWQSSANGTTFTNIAGATASTYNTNQAGTTYYRAIITCPTGNLSTTTDGIQIITTIVDAPTVASSQTFCDSATVEDLTAEEEDVLWYASATAEEAIDPSAAVTEGEVVYAGITFNGCESTRVAVTVHITVTPPPTGEATQTLTQVDDLEFFTIEDIEVEASGEVTWYANMEDALAGENALDDDTVIENGTYYAVNTANSCSSTPFAVTVEIVLGVTDFDAKAFSYYPNPVSGVLNIGYSKNITGVEVYNLVGQKVFAQQVNSTNVQIDLQALAAGSYLVKVTTDTAATTFKVLKN